jgi:hypothetical protein
MATYEVILKDRTSELIDAADAYQQEGQMTTFFATGAGKQVVDCWSTRLASFRTSEVLIIRRLADDVPIVHDAPPLPGPTVAATASPAGAAAAEVARLDRRRAS